MAPIRSLLPSILLAIVFASSTGAVPGASADAEYLRAATRSTFTVGKRAVPVEAYHPPSSFETFGEGLEQPANFRLLATDPQTEARQFVAERLRVNRETVKYRSGFNNGNVRHAYVRQEINGVPFANAVANVAFRDNKVVSFGSSFVKPKNVANVTPSIEVEDVLPAVEELLGGKYNGHPTRLEYLARPDGSAALTFAAQIENPEENTWYEAFIDAHTGDLLSVVDFTADAAYRVLPIQKQAFPEGTEIVTDPQDIFSSPSGWHAEGETLNTSGNNVVSYKTSLTTGLTSQSDTDLFDYAYSDAFAPSNVTNVAAATVNAFYIINSIHDFTYRYGFTEKTFNFQNDNFDKGGVGNDRVQVSVQDASGTNNANFATPPDGQPGRCRMYIWTSTTPNRDGALQNDILVHEVTHGISNRLTGGGGANCLQTTESRGLGEGWSDALAEWTQQKSATIVDYVLGNYVTNNPGGIRTRPYSVSNVTNPQTFASARGQTSVHRIGEIWANMLHNVYAALVGQHGWSATAKTNPDGTEGNVVWLHLFLDALALQPCNPGFVTARDAWIQADVNRYGGANKCLLWRAFASRGLGLKAASFVDDFSAPTECEFKQEF